MIEKIKNPKNVAIVTLITCLISIIYVLILNMSYGKLDDLSYFLKECLRDIFMSSSLTILIYLGLILFKGKINLSLLNKITLVQFGIILFMVISVVNGYFMNFSNIGYLLLVLAVAVNLLLLELNKKINITLFMIIEYVIFLIHIIPFNYLEIYKAIAVLFPKGLILHLFYLPFIYYIYLYGKSKNRKELKK